MINSSQIVDYYELFYSKTSGYSDYSLKKDSRNDTMIANFLLKLTEWYKVSALGESFLFEYFSFQFSRKYDRKTRLGKGVIPLNHIIGQKALLEWIDRDEHWQYFADQFCDKFNIKIKIPKQKLSIIKQLEEVERARFYNTNDGFSNCFISEIEYNNKSKYCLTCKFKKECMNI